MRCRGVGRYEFVLSPAIYAPFMPSSALTTLPVACGSSRVAQLCCLCTADNGIMWTMTQESTTHRLNNTTTQPHSLHGLYSRPQTFSPYLYAPIVQAAAYPCVVSRAWSCANTSVMGTKSSITLQLLNMSNSCAPAACNWNDPVGKAASLFSRRQHPSALWLLPS